MFGNKWQRGLILICYCICVLLIGCQQLPYRDIVHYVDPQQPECDYIVNDGFDETCVQYIRTVERVYIEIPVEKIKVVREIVEVEKIKIVEIKVPGETVYVEVPVETIKVIQEKVEVEKIVYEEKIVYQDRIVYEERIVYEDRIVYQDRIVYRDSPVADPVIVTDKLYDSQDYLNWVAAGKPAGMHEHTFTHTHHGVRHRHRIAHPNGQADNWNREHDGQEALTHE